jgi:hypothetical protein
MNENRFALCGGIASPWDSLRLAFWISSIFYLWPIQGVMWVYFSGRRVFLGGRECRPRNSTIPSGDRLFLDAD